MNERKKRKDEQKHTAERTDEQAADRMCGRNKRATGLNNQTHKQTDRKLKHNKIR